MKMISLNIVAIAALLFSGAASALTFAPYGATAPGHVVTFTFTLPSTAETVFFTFENFSTTVNVNSGAVALESGTGSPGQESSPLPNGTYSFEDEDGGVLRVKAEDGKFTVLQ